MSRAGVRPGASRKVVRVSVELPNECYQRLPELPLRIDDWEKQITADY